MDEPSVLTIHTDGASRGNPGAAAFAYVIERDGADPIEEAGCLGQMTNNQAEYTALVKALEHALELGAGNRLLIHSDSELLVKQMNGEYRVKNEELRDLYEQARNLVRRFSGSVTIRHVRRGQNSRADALGNEALDGLREPTPRASHFAAGSSKPKRQVENLPHDKPKRQVENLPHEGLRAEALACLRRAGAAAPERAWAELEEVLKRHGVRLPPGR
jgi:ribonuclease HI